MMKKYFLTLFFSFVLISIWSQTSIATYSVTFNSNWSNTTHPHPTDNFPVNAHWSDLVGATHNSNILFFENGQNASSGIENMAELGNNTVLFSEINTAIDNGFSNQIIDGDDLPTSLGTIFIGNIITPEEFPLLTLVSMIAPSPDWFVGVNSVSLLDTEGDWIEEIIIDLYPYDAGTDNGLDYDATNSNTDPQIPIATAQGISPFSSEKMVTLTIILEDVSLNVNDFEQEKKLTIFPNPCHDKISVSISNTEINSITIYNVLGKKMRSFQTNNATQVEIDLSNLSSGIYLLSALDSTNSIITKKIVKL